MTKNLAVLALCAGIAVAGSAQATLIDRGGGLIYDDALNITWLQDANYAKTSGYDSDGAMNWYQAMAWAGGLSYYDSVRNITYDDWRLPSTQEHDTSCSGQTVNVPGGPYGYGSNCVGSEMGDMFYNKLNGTAGNRLIQNEFLNLQSFYYWSVTEYSCRGLQTSDVVPANIGHFCPHYLILSEALCPH